MVYKKPKLRQIFHENCIKCNNKTKGGYQWCYACFSKWDAIRNDEQEHRKFCGICHHDNIPFCLESDDEN